MVDISLTGLPGCGVVFLLHFEDELALSSFRRCGGRASYSSTASVKCLQGSQSRGKGPVLSESTVDWLPVASYLVGKIPFGFLEDFPQQQSELSSIGHTSLRAAGCLLEMSFGSVYMEFLKGR